MKFQKWELFSGSSGMNNALTSRALYVFILKCFFLEQLLKITVSYNWNSKMKGDPLLNH